MSLESKISEKIIKNTKFNTLGSFWTILVALFLTPYIINRIGIERYGIWAIVGAITGYFGLLDLGIGTSFVKYIAEFYTKKDYEKINQVVNTGFIFYLVFAILIIPLGFLTINPIVNFFNISPALHDEALFVFLLGIILFAISNALSPFMAVQAGLQRMDVSNKVAVAISIPMIIGTIFFLESGYGLPGLMVNNAIILVITIIANIAIAFKIFPELKFNICLFDKEMFKKLFGFGYKIQVIKIGTMIQFQTDKIILAYFLGVGFVAYYAVASQLALRIREIPLLLISAILPAASELDAKTDKKSLDKLYFRSMKYLALVGLSLFSLAILLAHPFINIWLGAGFERSVLTLQILILGYFFTILTGPGAYILNGIGKPQYAMKVVIWQSILNLILSILLAIKIGYFGVVLGTTASIIIGVIYFIPLVHRVIDVPLGETFFKIFFKPLISCSITFLIFFILIGQLKYIGWFNLVGIGLLYLMLFSLIILTIGYLDDFDKALIRGCFSSIYHRRA